MKKKTLLPDDRTLGMLTPEELRERKRVSMEDQGAIIRLVEAVKALSPLICLSMDRDGLAIQKRVTNGYALGIKVVRKKSLSFDNRI